MDECAVTSHACSANAQCVNTLGKYTCQCNQGFYGNGTHCAGAQDALAQACAAAVDLPQWVCACDAALSLTTCRDNNECAYSGATNCHKLGGT